MDFLLLIPICILSALLYRIPRGGPSKDVWRKWIGNSGPGSFFGSMIWASFTGFAVVMLTVFPWWAGVILTIVLMLGEAPGWSNWWPNQPDGGSMWKLNLRGSINFNPFMGFVYFFFYKIRNKLKVDKTFVDGWTVYSELANGLITAILFSGTVIGISMYWEQIKDFFDALF